MGFQASVTLAGPIWSAVTAHQIDNVINALAQEGDRLVKDQLYPGHGVLTGHFRRSVWGGLVKSRYGQIDAGMHSQGDNVIYANWLEGISARNAASSFAGYAMFANATKQLEGRVQDAKFVAPLLAALGG